MSKPPRVPLNSLITGEVAPRPAAPAPVQAATPEPLPAPRPQVEPAAAAERTVVRHLEPVRSRKAEAGQGTLRSRAKQLSLYLEVPVYDQLRDIAHSERCKMHQLVIEGIDLLLKKRGAPSIKELMKRAG